MYGSRETAQGQASGADEADGICKCFWVRGSASEPPGVTARGGKPCGEFVDKA